MSIKTGRNSNIKRKIDITGAQDWTTNKEYKKGDIVKNSNKIYLCVKDHTSGASFDDSEQTNFIEVTGGVSVTKMSAWKLDIKQNLIDASHFGDDAWDDSVPGTKNWSGQIDGSWNITDDPYGQKAVQDAIASGDPLDLEFLLDEDVESEKYSGLAYVEDVSIDTKTKDLIKISIKFKGKGKLQMP
jgi:predicted secreted protein